MKLVKQFWGVPDGEIYPRLFDIGEECPVELRDAAIAEGALAEEKAERAVRKPKAEKAVK